METENITDRKQEKASGALGLRLFYDCSLWTSACGDASVTSVEGT
jgi:hypothetical protein